MTRRELYGHLMKSARVAYAGDEKECKAVAGLVAGQLWNAEYHKYLADPDAEVPGVDGDYLMEVCRQIEGGRPVQYIAGRSWFMGHELRVREGVLIPRSETEELVAWIRDTADKQAIRRILDVGTGSGAIAIALAGLFGDAAVCGADVSDDALMIARQNASLNEVNVDFRKIDVLRPAEQVVDLLPWREFDIVVSNPPYIPQSDFDSMHDNVRLYEPHEALFVPDEDVLLFYRAIGELGMNLLKSGGLLFFECYIAYAKQVAELLNDMGYADIECREDMFGKPRMVKAVR